MWVMVLFDLPVEKVGAQPNRGNAPGCNSGIDGKGAGKSSLFGESVFGGWAGRMAGVSTGVTAGAAPQIWRLSDLVDPATSRSAAAWAVSCLAEKHCGAFA